MNRHVLGLHPALVRVFLAAWVLAACLSASVARADKLTDAEELFRRAKSLMSENKHREACPLLEESEKLDPQMGTLLNLAICHETTGRIASAWGEFRAVEQMAKQANREDRAKLARERAAKLEPRLPRIKIVVPPEAKVSGLAVKVDGEAKGEPLWSGVAVDPGERSVEASAPGKRAVTLKVKVESEGSLIPVTIPKLEDAPISKPKVAAVGPSDEELASNRSRKTTGLIVGGVGVAIAAAGGVFGALAIARDNDAHAQCPKPCIAGSKAAAAADASTDRALLFANVSNVAIPVGVLVVLVGGYFFFSAGPTERPRTGASRSWRSRLTLTPGGVGGVF